MSDRTHELYNGEITIDFKDSNHSYWTTFGGKPKKDGTPAKRRLCGVTTYLGIIDKPALINWAVNVTIDYVRENIDELQDDPYKILRKAKKEAQNKKDEAADIGSAIHDWIEMYIKGQKPDMPEDERVLLGVVNFLNYIEPLDIEFVGSEIIVYSKKHDYVGTLDILVRIDGDLYLIDIKTGNAIYGEVKAQTATYREAWEEEHGEKIKGRWVWRISKETEEQYNERMEKKGRGSYDQFTPFEAVYLDHKKGLQKRDFKAFLAAKQLYEWKKAEYKD